MDDGGEDGGAPEDLENNVTAFDSVLENHYHDKSLVMINSPLHLARRTLLFCQGSRS